MQTDKKPMTPLFLLSLPALRGPRRSTLLASGATTLGTSPPSLRHDSATAWQRLMCWLLAPSPGHKAHPINRVPGVRLELFEEQALGAEREGRRPDAMAAWRKLSLLSELAGASDRLRSAPGAPEFELLATPTPLWARALDLLGVSPRLWPCQPKGDRVRKTRWGLRSRGCAGEELRL